MSGEEMRPRGINLASLGSRRRKRRRLGKGDWGERVRDSLPFSLFPFLPLPLPFHCALACVAGVERGRGRGWDVQYAQPSL